MPQKIIFVLVWSLHFMKCETWVRKVGEKNPTIVYSLSWNAVKHYAFLLSFFLAPHAF